MELSSYYIQHSLTPFTEINEPISITYRLNQPLSPLNPFGPINPLDPWNRRPIPQRLIPHSQSDIESPLEIFQAVSSTSSLRR